MAGCSFPLLLLAAAGAAAGAPPPTAKDAAEAVIRGAKLGSFELTTLSPTRSEGRAVLSVSNPFDVPVRIVSASCRVEVNGKEVGGGLRHGRVLKASKKKVALELPFKVRQDLFLAAAGDRWAVGAEVDARLAGSMTVRFGAEEATVPFELSGRMGTDGARSGVFSLPDGATSLSPR